MLARKARLPPGLGGVGGNSFDIALADGRMPEPSISGSKTAIEKKGGTVSKLYRCRE
jgi:hypothetical protein